ncbi:MAG: GIY-YIG nuclease family protein [Polyangia bacterium]
MKLTLHLLEDERPTGPRTAKIDQWSGRALCVPRDDLEKVQKSKELDGPCLYFLIAQSGSATAPRVYVGEADGFRNRIKSHLASKDWWSVLVVFYSTDGSLTKAGIQYLESTAVTRLRAAGWCKIENGNAPDLPSVPEEDKGGLKLFLKNVTIIMPVLGYNLFEEAPASASGSDEAVESAAVSSEKTFDTIVCPARDSGFESAFLGQRAWWAIRIREENIPKIRNIAMYRVAPISAITHYGEVQSIEHYTGSDRPEGKFKVILKGEPHQIANPVGLGKNIHIKPQGPKYANLADILRAKTLDDVFAK